MEGIINFFKNNYHWIFSGIGVLLISLIIKFLFKNKKAQNQKIGNDSLGIQVGGDFTINSDDKSKKDN